MSWRALLELIAEEVGQAQALRIEQRARQELGGVRLTIAKRVPITSARIDEIAPGNAKKAAQKLGVHHSTVYRVMHRARLVR